MHHFADMIIECFAISSLLKGGPENYFLIFVYFADMIVGYGIIFADVKIESLAILSLLILIIFDILITKYTDVGGLIFLK